MEVESKSAAGQTVWTASQSTFVHTFLANFIDEGLKTSTGFKKVHLNKCAEALNEKFKLNRIGDHIGNHLKTMRRRYGQINQLRGLSGALWDEDQYIISLDHEHYQNHFENPKNKGDDEYINKPLPYYGNLATIFGNSVATGQFAKSSNEPLGVDADCTAENDDNGAATAMTNGQAQSDINDANGASCSAATRPYKKAKVVEAANESLAAVLERSTQTLANAIKEAAVANRALPEGLFSIVDNLPGFEIQDKSRYYGYLVANRVCRLATIVQDQLDDHVY
ncbi:hypothetical protein GQ55_9G167600 [Panicum hallii var. hallii]|uniref:Myb/SANT-like domain-containing protein n=1 Tax=Panicum hallii var. hallii TaxID=1504633 RepID=A0A2T7C407_9POAL|nr:hypothetical protein GQ55_9G167600 [Panicum hallii var. hallii]